ncbi:unnamed protein product [Rotaria sp. Silwood1]|nr:unnamed protein product [Rotaria sp. Silwood1]CAF3395185.1 unnamed protein product [Rotaria sp. Silwood1]CAF4559722.1 unnamed protein product [Rotaria sp. Silwood1]
MLETIYEDEEDTIADDDSVKLTDQRPRLSYYVCLYVQNQTYILWIYAHLKYPQSCIDNTQCKENLKLNLKTSFMKLSSFLTKIELDLYQSQQIQLDWCNLIENSTTITLVSLVSIKTKNQSALETITTSDRNICENIDQTVSISKAIHNIMQNKDSTTNIPIRVLMDNQISKNPTDVNKNSIINDEEININCHNPTEDSKYSGDYNQHEKSTHYSNDVDSQYFMI